MKHKTHNQETFHAPHSTLHERGITLYLAMITLSAALATALFVAGSLTREYKISNGLANSLKAVYVADSVIEYTLYQVRTGAYAVTSTDASITITLPDTSSATLSCDVNPDLSLNCPASALAIATSLVPILSTTNCSSLLGIANGACAISGQLIAPGIVAGCPSDPLAPPPNCVYLRANGSYGGTNRAIEIVYENK